MHREVRLVPANWEHPRDQDGSYIRTFAKFPYEEGEIAEGVEEGWLDPSLDNYGVAVMPQWPREECTHYQMYECTTEGTPISPVMDSPEALARWLEENEASIFSDWTADYETWLAVIYGSRAMVAFTANP